jgi:hypothetical protein
MMPPAPATMAAPPMIASPASWNPAVPPPPVTGAPTGTELADGLGDGLMLVLTLTEGLGDGLMLVLTLTEGLGAGVVASVVTSFGEIETLAETDTLTETLALTLALALGENTLPVEVEEPDVQAETATQAKTASRPPPMAPRFAPTAVRFAPMAPRRARCAIHEMAVRATIGPPHVSAGQDVHFPAGGHGNRRREENA